jgi:hypothetical protein
MSWIEGNQERGKKSLPEVEHERQEKLEGFLEENVAREELVKFFKNNLSVAANFLMGINLYPIQQIILRTMFERDYVLNILGRGSSKTIAVDDNHLLIDEKGGVISSKTLCKNLPKMNEDTVVDIDPLSLWNGRSFQKTSRIIFQPNKKCMKVSTSCGYYVKGSENHKIKVLDRRDCKISWKRYHELDVENHYICISRNEKVDWGRSEDREKDESYMVGLLVGDGHMGERQYSITNMDKDIIDFCLPFIGKKGPGSKAGTEAKTLRLRNDVKFYLKEKYAIEDGLSYSKKIPEGIWRSKQTLKNFLMGLFDTDGCWGKDRSTVSFGSVSERLCDDVSKALLLFGIISRKREKKTGSKFGKFYVLYITGEDALKFFDRVGFRLKRKQIGAKKLRRAKRNTNYDLVFGANRITEEYSEKLNRSGRRFWHDNLRGRTRKEISYNFLRERLSLLENQGAEYGQNFKEIESEGFFFDKISKIENTSVDCIDFCDIPDGASYWCNGFINHNSYMSGVFAGLYALLNPNQKIGILSSSFRQSKHIFKYVESFSESKKGSLFRDCVTSVNHRNDEYSMTIGTSSITAVPLGDGAKLRGYRFTVILVDELLLMPKRILNEVIFPFISVVPNPTERDALTEAEDFLISEGKMTEDERYHWPHNKLIGLSSASYAFEYLYELYQVYEALITGDSEKMSSKALADYTGAKNIDEAKSSASRAIVHMSYDAMPKGMYEKAAIEQFKATMSESQFARELGSVFTNDSSGFFKISKMLACTVGDGDEPSIELKGEKDADYILAMDPSWAENSSSDDFAMHVLKLDEDAKTATVVHSYAIHGGSLKQHMDYFLYILDNFNIVMVWADYAGGSEFINGCNESQLFKDRGLNLGVIPVDFDDGPDYEKQLFEGRRLYSKETHQIVCFRKFNSDWIRRGNELLQANFDHKKIWFGGKCLDRTWHQQLEKEIPIEKIEFLSPCESERETEKGPKMIDFLEWQSGLLTMTKAECALIQVKSNPQGSQSFDLPENIKRQTGQNRTRRDSYTALVIGNWGVKVYFDIMKTDATQAQATFEPEMF